MVEFKDKKYGLTVSIEDEIMKELEESAINSYPNETGGFLVGKYDYQNHAHIYRLLEPTSKKGTPCSYERSTEGMEKTWDALYQQGLIYLGEWHTHPNGSSHYSLTDFNTIQSITKSHEVQIIRPLLLIASIVKYRVRDIRLYYYYDGQLLKLN